MSSTFIPPKRIRLPCRNWGAGLFYDDGMAV
jgi:hypothetical protein